MLRLAPPLASPSSPWYTSPMSLFRIMVDHAEWNANVNRAMLSGIPEVVAQVLNVHARLSGVRQLQNLRRDMTLRNDYTEKSLYIGKGAGSDGLFWPAVTTVPINRMNAVVGSKSPYLPIQEKGGVKQKAGSMPTVAGRGGDERSPIPNYFRLRAMGSIAGGQGQLTAKGRRRRGKGFFILNPGPVLKQRAIFFREPGNTYAQIQKIRLLGKRVQVVKPTHFHSEAVKYYGTWAKFNQTFQNVMKLHQQMRKLAAP